MKLPDQIHFKIDGIIQSPLNNVLTFRLIFNST